MRVAAEWSRPEESAVQALAGISTTVIGDAMHRLGALSGDIRPMWHGARAAGTAVTVWVRSGDNLRIHEAIALAQPGDILVVNGQGSVMHGVFGELMALAAQRLGIRGVVIDGAVRDRDVLERLRFPVFARAACAAGPSKEGTGEVGYPVAVGGVVCAAGDVVIGDSDGVVVVPAGDTGPVLARAAAVTRWESAVRAELITP
jgi:regulator of RNase E activity RraA